MLLLKTSTIDAKAFSLVEPLKAKKHVDILIHIFYHKQKPKMELNKLMTKYGNFKIE